jgi:hypothetical protein
VAAKIKGILAHAHELNITEYRHLRGRPCRVVVREVACAASAASWD